MKIGKLIVDGTKDLIADGRKVTMHAIAKETDYTHMRVVGYARDLDQANRFAASDEMLEILNELLDIGDFTSRARAINLVKALTGEA